MRKILILILMSLFSFVSIGNADVNFAGKTITWVVPFKEGGGTSRFARFIQPFLKKYLPGNPDVQIMHIPGGGAIKGSNYFEKNAKADGTFIFGCSTSVIVNVATGNPLVKYNLSEYRPVVLLPQNTHWFTRSDLAEPHDLSKIKELGSISFHSMSDFDVQLLLEKKGWKLEGDYNRGLATQLVFEKTCEYQLIQPTFITDHPRETSPLCKQTRQNPELIERFEVFINGWEIANAYSELNDPVIQRRLMEEQVERGRGGEKDTHPLDEDFLRAMEYGMPPMGGVGFGIDRIVMLLTGQSTIRDVILFPTMRTEF